MSLSSNFEATIENAPCPPFFVENVYDIFINTAANNNLTANVTEEVWIKCTLQYPYPTTTTTTTTLSSTSTTEQTTTTTPKQTTTTPKQTTTTTPKQTTTTTTPRQTTTTPKLTTTTPKQTTIITTQKTETTTTPKQTTTITTPSQTTTTPKLTTTTPKQTTIITTQETETTTTPKQKTTATWQTTTTTQQQTTTSQKQITTTTKQTSTSTTKLTTTSATKQTTTSTIKPTTSAPTSTPTTTTTEQTTSLTTSSSEAVTRSPATLILSSKCDTVCLSLALMFSVCVLLGILITLIYCNMRHRHKKHVMKHSNRPKRKISNGKYIPKFPKMSKQADLKKSPLAFINPSFLTEHEHMSDPFDYYSAEYQPVDNMYPWNHPQNDLFLEYNQPHYELIFSSGGRQFHADEKRNHRYSNMGGNPSHADEFAKRRSRHPSIGSHVPKMLPEYAEIYPFGIEVYDTSSRNSGLPKIDLDYNNADEKIDTVIREHKLPRIPFENDFVSDSPYKGTDTRQDHPGEKNEEHKRGNGAFIHGLPRIPLDLEHTGGELSEKPSWQLGLPKPQIDKRYSREIEHEENYIRHPKHGLRRTPIEPSGLGHFELNKRNRTEDDFADRERQNNGDNGKFKSNTYSLYQGRKDGSVSRVNKSKSHHKEGDTSDQSFTYSVPYTKL